METQLITLKDELKVKVNTWGAGNTISIILLHGLGSTGQSFAQIARKLSSDYRVIAIDLPGHGGSTYDKEKAFFLFFRKTKN